MCKTGLRRTDCLATLDAAQCRMTPNIKEGHSCGIEQTWGNASILLRQEVWVPKDLDIFSTDCFENPISHGLRPAEALWTESS